MKKATISITYEEEKLNALKLFLPKNNIDLETEIVSAIEKIYKKNVPVDVRNYISSRYGEDK